MWYYYDFSRLMHVVHVVSNLKVYPAGDSRNLSLKTVGSHQSWDKNLPIGLDVSEPATGCYLSPNLQFISEIKSENKIPTSQTFFFPMAFRMLHPRHTTPLLRRTSAASLCCVDSTAFWEARVAPKSDDRINNDAMANLQFGARWRRKRSAKQNICWKVTNHIFRSQFSTAISMVLSLTAACKTWNLIGENEPLTSSFFFSKVCHHTPTCASKNGHKIGQHSCVKNWHMRSREVSRCYLTKLHQRHITQILHVLQRLVKRLAHPACSCMTSFLLGCRAQAF